MPPPPFLPGKKVPAEVSKRGVMIGNFEGALSSRRKRANSIIPKFFKKASPDSNFLYFFRKGGCRLFFINSRKGKMIQTKVGRRFPQPAQENVT
jgi:hypothetical protein